MKNKSIKLLLVLLAATQMNSVFAHSALNTPIRLIEVKAEYYPKETYYLGYTENPDHTIKNVFYENNEHERRFYTLKQLKKDVPIIQSTDAGTVYDMVRLNVQPGDDKTYDVSMSYMKNGLFKNRKTVEYSMVYNYNRRIYELRNSETDQLINRIYVTTNFWGSRAVGISGIKSSP